MDVAAIASKGENEEYKGQHEEKIVQTSPQETPSAIGLYQQLGLLDKFLPIWIIVAMIVGVVIGYFCPGVQDAFETVQLDTVSVPIAVGLLVMMYPVLCKVQYEILHHIFRQRHVWVQIGISIVLNWIIGPIIMTALAWATLPDLPGYRTGIVFVGLARCIAMVLIWNQLAHGDPDYCAILVAINSILQIALYSPYSLLFVSIIPSWFGATEAVTATVDVGTVAKSVLIYLGIPLAAGAITRFTLRRWKGHVWYQDRFLPIIGPFALIGLLYTIIVMFAYQGHHIISDIGQVCRVAVPLIIYFLIMYFSTFLILRAMSFPYEYVTTQTFTASSNNFELAIAVAIGAYGINSEEALAATIGPLIEVPVLLALVYLNLFFGRRLTWGNSRKPSKHKSSCKSPTALSKKLTRQASFDVVGNDWIPPPQDESDKGKKKKGPLRGQNLQYDRYIPNREAMVGSYGLSITDSVNSKEGYLDSATIAYQEEIARACGVSLDKRVLAFKAEPPSNDKEDLRVNYGSNLQTNLAANFRRRILTAPERVLDAPNLLDDYYLNLLDWGPSNILAIGLERQVFLWHADSGDVTCLETTGESELITSIKWSGDGSFLAMGTSEGECHIWDVASGQRIRTMNGHSARVGVMSWDKHIMSSGSRDTTIVHHDVRVREHNIATLKGHSGELCGLEWRADGLQLASGGNDNVVNIWDARSTTPRMTKTNHTAAVKALAWCPWQNSLLASGGGTHDRNIHFWNATTGARVNSIDTGSQVTSLIWSREYKEILSSHGYPDNQISLWSYPSLKKIVDIPAHDMRVLHTTVSPDFQVVASAAADENLKFWRMWESRPKGKGDSAPGKDKKDAGASKSKIGMTIR
ncbi:hypothetical protein BZG36_02483 [Bifiguratus adelaidae]|uniref:CDC20/Fizzy WD40 domain-containing protein n=1 Tax=Bifiguratus adelaidae TaxID=1938954 RepID=A0A261Y0V2_9FUNG|nr:hypothetical protein BZG36_02483 [Bifiguratus adelaidae]